MIFNDLNSLDDVPTSDKDPRSGMEPKETISPRLAGKQVAFLGKLGSLNRREAQSLVRRSGGVPVSLDDVAVNLIVIGADEFMMDSAAMLDADMLEKVDQGSIELVHETELLEELNLVDRIPSAQRHYTPSMLAQLLGVPTTTIRRWHRQGLITPVREVYRLPYFDFEEVISARRLAQLLAAGTSPAQIESKLRQLSRLFPGVERPLAQLSVIVDGGDILLRDGEGLVDSGGQRRFDFDACEQMSVRQSDVENGTELAESGLETQATIQFPQATAPPDPEMLLSAAAGLEAEGKLGEAIAAYRSLLFTGFQSADVHFLLAEVLYRQGDVSAARERYYATLEIDENFVEARANLGCVLVETGQPELAIAAFEGALARHPEYPDVLFYLARTLDDLGQEADALQRWHEFLNVAPNSPWASEARDRLGIDD